MKLDAAIAERFARVALTNVGREYPRKLDHLLIAKPGDLAPRANHPAFYGSYDWHSAVHMHWLLVRLLRVQPNLPAAAEIIPLLDAHLSDRSLAAELAYLQVPERHSFERPYGWAWLLELRAEALRLARDRPEGRRWAKALEPLATCIAGRMREFLAIAAYPIRAGAHANSAFACVLALDYARTAGDTGLAAGIETAARSWYLADRDAPLAYEPSLADFLSPALTEAQLMREVLPRAEFAAWLSTFLTEGLGGLALPPVVPDRSDAQICHLDGLALSRAWSLQRIAAGLPQDAAPELARACAAAAQRHLAVGLPQAVGGDYVGEHWLASFAALALCDVP